MGRSVNHPVCDDGDDQEMGANLLPMGKKGEGVPTLPVLWPRRRCYPRVQIVTVGTATPPTHRSFSDGSRPVRGRPAGLCGPREVRGYHCGCSKGPGTTSE
jgi:hypothetical protein